MKTKEELHKTFQELDEKLEQAEADLQELQQFSEKLDKMLSNIQELENYYHSEWLEERDVLLEESQEVYYKTLGEDAIWNVSTDFYQEKVQLLKKLIGSM